MFTIDNTAGYSQADLDELNARLEIQKRKWGYYETDNEDLRQHIEKNASDQVHNEAFPPLSSIHELD